MKEHNPLIPFGPLTTAFLIFIGSLAIGVTNAYAENQPDPDASDTSEALDPTLSSLNTLTELLNSRAEKTKQQKQFQRRLNFMNRESEKEQLEEIVKRLDAELNDFENKISSVATGLSEDEFNLDSSEAIDLRTELEDLINPLVLALKNVTQQARQIEKLRHALLVGKKHQNMADGAVASIQELLRHSEDPVLKERLQGMLESWMERKTAANNLTKVIQNQLDNKLASKTSLADSTGESIREFFRHRGTNFLVGLAAFFGFIFVMRLLYRIWSRFHLRRKQGVRSFYSRLADLSFQFVTLVGAVVAMLIVFNARNDGFLLGITLIFVIVIGWVAMKMLPNFVEQLMLLLNLGSVREGERVMFNGIPWHVKSLHFYSQLENPDLSGGSLLLPARELIGMHSRPSPDNEPWFPCKEGDWVELEDDTVGKIVLQSPEVVELVELGGARTTYLTENFLGMNPKNMSRNFRIEIEFGVDYQYQPICTTEIPRKLKEKLAKGLLDLVDPEDLLHVEVEFMEAAASSLNYEVEADIRGSAAHLYEDIERRMATLLVEACNENNWVIPFQQITIHQASPESA